MTNATAMRMGRVPQRISPAIRDFANTLAPNSRAEYVPLQPRPDAVDAFCTYAVEAHIAEHGGRIRYGWRLSEWPTVWLEAEFHAVWESPTGDVLDVAAGDTTRTLFVWDPEMEYDGARQPNVFWPLRESDDVRRVILSREAEFQIMDKGPRAYATQVSLSPDEQLRLGLIYQERNDAIAAIMRSIERKLTAKSPCYCGSGKKYKRCCRRAA